jgi:glycine cleavage system aminomethyltransferase T
LHSTSYKLQASEVSLAWLTYKRAILWWTSAQETGHKSSPRLEKNIGFAMLPIKHADMGNKFERE